MSIDRALEELPCVRAMGFKKRYWTPEEDEMLISYINKHGHGNWCALPKQAGLKRCGKSCRLRWRNYLRPDIKRGNFSLKEVQTIFELHQILGNRWSAIASHLPGRTDNEIKYVWNSYSKQRLMQIGTDPVTHALRGSSCYAAVSIQDNHREQADHDFQSHGCTPDSVKTVFKREGNSNESLSSQIKPLEEQGASNNWTFLIQKIPDDQNMINSEQLEAYYSLNSTGNSYSYSTDSPRLFSTKPMEIVSASPFGLCGAMDLKEQTNSEKLAAVIPFDYIKTSEEKMHIKTSEEKMLAMDYTSLLQSNYTDYIGCGKCQEDDKLVDGQQAYQEGNPAYDFSMLSNNVEFWRRELLLRPPTENNTLGDQTVAFSSLKDAAHVGGQQKSVKVESTGTNFSVEQFLEQADHNMGMGSNNIEGRSNIYDSWPDMILADRDQVMKYWVKLLGHVGPMPFLETISRVPDL